MFRSKLSRRLALKTTLAWAGAAVLPRSLRAQPQAEVLQTRVISRQFDLYHGWPTLARQRNGRLLLVWSGGREAHVCPFGRVDWMTSSDGGNTWTWPRTLLDGAIDDRDSGVLETSRGTLLVTSFSSLAWESVLEQAERSGDWPAVTLQRWQAARRRLPAELRKQELGTWMLRSTDGGLTWSKRYDSLVNSPHGPVQLSDGRILYAGKQLWRENPRVGVAISEDDGVSWSWLAEIPAREGDDPQQYHELHAVQAADGRLIAQIRNHNPNNQQETLQSESVDGGSTWSEPRSIGVWGYPSHLLRLDHERLLMTYGHRRSPIGNQARISSDHGRTWSEPILISQDATSSDLGYPTTVQRDDGVLVTVWYETMADHPKAVLRSAQWRLRDV
jgi:sialidase-1